MLLTGLAVILKPRHRPLPEPIAVPALAERHTHHHRVTSQAILQHIASLPSTHAPFNGAEGNTGRHTVPSCPDGSIMMMVVPPADTPDQPAAYR
jgi:hypothetical protein